MESQESTSPTETSNASGSSAEPNPTLAQPADQTPVWMQRFLPVVRGLAMIFLIAGAAGRCLFGDELIPGQAVLDWQQTYLALSSVFTLLGFLLGILLVMLWSLGAEGARPGWPGLLWMALLCWTLLGAMAAPYNFPALSQFWILAGLVFAWTLMRFESPRLGPGPMILLVIALGIGQANLFGQQYFDEQTARQQQAQAAAKDIQPNNDPVKAPEPSKTEFIPRQQISRWDVDQRLYRIDPQPDDVEPANFARWGTFFHRDTLVGLLVLSSVLLAGLACASLVHKSLAGALVSALGLLVVLYQLALISQPTSWAAVMVGWCTLLALIRSKKPGFLSLVGGLCFGLILISAAAGVGAWFHPPIHAYLEYEAQLTVDWVLSCWNLYVQRPFLGVGWGNFLSEFPAHHFSTLPSEAPQPPSWVLEWLNLSGAPGLILYSVLLIVALKETVTSIDQTDEENADSGNSQEDPLPAGTPWWWWMGVLFAGLLIGLFLYGTEPTNSVWPLAIGFVVVALMGLAGRSIRSALAHPQMRWAVASAVVAFHLYFLVEPGGLTLGLFALVWLTLASVQPAGRLYSLSRRWCPHYVVQILTICIAVMMELVFLLFFFFPLQWRYQYLDDFLRSDIAQYSPEELEVQQKLSEMISHDQTGHLWLARLYAKRLGGPFDLDQRADSFREGSIQWTAARQLNPNDPRINAAHIQLTLLRAKEDRLGRPAELWTQILGTFEMWISHNPRSPFPHYLYAKVLLDADQVGQARFHYRLALELDRHAPNVDKLTQEQRENIYHIFRNYPYQDEDRQRAVQRPEPDQ